MCGRIYLEHHTRDTTYCPQTSETFCSASDVASHEPRARATAFQSVSELSTLAIKHPIQVWAEGMVYIPSSRELLMPFLRFCHDSTAPCPSCLRADWQGAASCSARRQSRERFSCCVSLPNTDHPDAFLTRAVTVLSVCQNSGTIRLASSILSYGQCLPAFRTNEACVKASRRLVQCLAA